MISNQYQRLPSSIIAPLKDDESTGKSLKFSSSFQEQQYPLKTCANYEIDKNDRCQAPNIFKWDSLLQSKTIKDRIDIQIYHKRYIILTQSAQLFQKSFLDIKKQKIVNEGTLLALQIVIIDKIEKNEKDYKLLKQKLINMYTNLKFQMISNL